MSTPSKIYLYHLVAMDCLPRIVEREAIEPEGRQSKGRPAHEQPVHQCGVHARLSERRSRRTVPCANEGRLCDYVSFHFGPRAPILQAIHRGMVQGYEQGQKPLIHLVTRVQLVADRELTFAFTDRHAVLAYAHFYDDLRAIDHVDYGLMRALHWHETDQHPQRKERRQAEFLVHESVPFDLVGAVGVIDEEAKHRAEHHLEPLREAPPVIVKPDWYY